MIYDDPEQEARGEDPESYYGFFTDTDEALHMFDQLQGGTTRFVDPMLCMVMGPISDHADD